MRSGTPARVTTVEGPAERMDDATRFVREQFLPQLQQLDGFKGFLALGDRQSGKVLPVRGDPAANTHFRRPDRIGSAPGLRHRYDHCGHLHH